MTDQSNSPFQRFALEFYSWNGCAETCIGLQDVFGLDVDVILYLIWAGKKCQVSLSGRDIANLVALVKPWNEAIVRPLRSVRRQLNAVSKPVAIAHAEAFKKRILELEIAAETIEMEILADAGDHCEQIDNPDPKPTVTNLYEYLKLVHGESYKIAEARQHVERLLELAFPEYSDEECSKYVGDTFTTPNTKTV